MVKSLTAVYLLFILQNKDFFFFWMEMLKAAKWDQNIVYLKKMCDLDCVQVLVVH